MEFGNLDTKEISKKLRMRRTTVYTLLRYMESKKIIKKVDLKVYHTHPTIVWSLTKSKA
jgi:sugar-specific transcriptional regulator TrmB